MTGPEHYCQAEQYAQQAARYQSEAIAATVAGEAADVAKRREWAAHAREMGVLHATLALAAATAVNDFEGGMPIRDHEAWMAVAGTPKPAEIPSGGEA
ncbi:hypothetical protein ABGB18_11305 [Nonomuraea sp. B12E4]|uniref:hypothetical protein n=1 Tax=Nonomuraea sp. B12E4 TaxID=3153564 RepID=UPI00325EADD1